MVKEKYYEAGEILAGLVHPQREVTNDKLIGPAEELPASKWILTSDYQIVCPLMIFDVKKFPLLIDKIMLGPNCPDIKVNQLQLELMIKEHIGLLRLSRKYDVVTTSG